MNANKIVRLNATNKSPLTELAGAVRVGETRVTLDSVIGAYRQGFSAEDIVGHFPDLRLEDVYSTLLIYLRHREEVDAYLDSRTAIAHQSREAWASRPNQQRLRDRLLERMKKAS